MSTLTPCNDCNNFIPPSASICPHCGRPSLYPNVRAAEDPLEKATLDNRYQAALNDAVSRGCNAVLRDFENAIDKSKAVMGRPLLVLQRLSTSENELYATYYELIEGGVRLPDNNRWDILRRVADAAFFPGYQNDIRFAALSLDGVAPSNYGECSIALRTDLIAHRASVVEENSVLFVDHHNILMGKADQLPRGYRATWADRARVCTAKLSGKIAATTMAEDFTELLLHQGTTSADDDFVEVHIWGPMTVRTIELVSISASVKSRFGAILNAVCHNLQKFGVRWT